MGLKKEYIAYINENIKENFDDYQGKCMLELGNQLIRNDNIAIVESTGKEYYTNMGFSHTSIDLNGQNGAISVDLSVPFKKDEWMNNFDVVTNTGTTEHVEPKKAQYTTFMNIHNCMKVGGISIHLVPDINQLEKYGKWKGHCRNYYSSEFFKMLTEYNDYLLVSQKIINGLICTTIKKTIDNEFMKNEKMFLTYISRKRGGVIYPGINDSLLGRTIYKILRMIKHYI